VPARVETPFRRFVSEFCESKVAVGGAIVFAAIALIAIFAPWIAPQNPYDLAQLDIMDGRQEPGTTGGAGFTFWLGTDDQGRDMMSGIMYGLRISLMVGVGSALIACVVGASLGLLAAYAGKKTDTVIMRLVDLQLSFPSILVALMILARSSARASMKIIIALVIGAMGLLCTHRARHGAGGTPAQGICRGGAVPRRCPHTASCSGTSCRTACRR
jgi:peptide/nickel transport system permease protein